MAHMIGAIAVVATAALLLSLLALAMLAKLKAEIATELSELERKRFGDCILYTPNGQC